MTETVSYHLIVIESRMIFGRLIRFALAHHYPTWKVHPVDSVDAAMKHAFGTEEENRRVAFVIGGNSYWAMLEYGHRIRACLPDSKFALVDDRTRPGCAAVADRLPVQGYVSLADKPENAFDCLEKVLSGDLYVSPQGKSFLETDLKSGFLRSRKSLRADLPCTFSDREWQCFRLLLSGRECEKIAETLDLKDRSAKNLKYRIMKKIGVQHFSDMLRIANQWGLLD